MELVDKSVESRYLVDELTKTVDKYNPDTVVGLINLLNKKLKESDDHTEAERCSLFPIEELEAFKLYKLQETMIWNNSEMEFSIDKDDYASFEPELQHIIDNIFAFFSFSDGRVIENLVFRLMLLCNTLEQRMFYGLQIFVEQVHSEFYSKTIDAIIPNPRKRESLYKALDNMPIMKKKDDWMTAYMEADLGPAYTILPYACVEGIFFQAGFAFILWFKVIGKMDNVVFGNIQVRKDEAVHRNFAIYKFKQLPESQKPPKEHVYKIIQEAVDLETEFIDHIIPKTVEYRSDPDNEFPDAVLYPEDVKEYIKLTGNHLLVALGYDSYWKIGELTGWLHEMAMEGKGNFYEKKDGNYTNFALTDMYVGSNEDYGKEMYANPEDVDF